MPHLICKISLMVENGSFLILLIVFKDYTTFPHVVAFSIVIDGYAGSLSAWKVV